TWTRSGGTVSVPRAVPRARWWRGGQPRRARRRRAERRADRAGALWWVRRRRRLRDGGAGLRQGDGGALRRGGRALPRRADLGRGGAAGEPRASRRRR